MPLLNIWVAVNQGNLGSLRFNDLWSYWSGKCYWDSLIYGDTYVCQTAFMNITSCDVSMCACASENKMVLCKYE